MAVCKDRDAKAELNRRGQICEVQADTGISRRVNRKDSDGAVRTPRPASGRENYVQEIALRPLEAEESRTRVERLRDNDLCGVGLRGCNGCAPVSEGEIRRRVKREAL